MKTVLLVISLLGFQMEDQARVVEAYGTVEKRIGTTVAPWQPVSVGDLLGPDIAIRTGADSAALLLLPDTHAVRVGEETAVELREVGRNGSFSFAIVTGIIWSFVNPARKPAKYEVQTPSALLGVSGGLFSVSHNHQSSETGITVDDGEVSVRQGNNTHNIGSGFQIRLLRNQPQRARLEPQDSQTRDMWRKLRGQLSNQGLRRLRELQEREKEKPRLRDPETQPPVPKQSS
jgi:hypothetical protein